MENIGKLMANHQSLLPHIYRILYSFAGYSLKFSPSQIGEFAMFFTANIFRYMINDIYVVICEGHIFCGWEHKIFVILFLRFTYILPTKCILMKAKSEDENFTDSKTTMKSSKFMSLKHYNLYDDFKSTFIFLTGLQ